jgi:small subunit ribosomal protein S16
MSSLSKPSVIIYIMLTLRLQRVGKNKQAAYRLIVSEKRHDTQRGSLEILGTYNPGVTPKEINLKKERIEHWLAVGAQTSDTVHNLLIDAGLVKADKRKSVTISNKRKAKMAKEAAAAAPKA